MCWRVAPRLVYLWSKSSSWCRSLAQSLCSPHRRHVGSTHDFVMPQYASYALACTSGELVDQHAICSRTCQARGFKVAPATWGWVSTSSLYAGFGDTERVRLVARPIRVRRLVGSTAVSRPIEPSLAFYPRSPGTPGSDPWQARCM
jgi:hypothetical protein